MYNHKTTTISLQATSLQPFYPRDTISLQAIKLQRYHYTHDNAPPQPHDSSLNLDDTTNASIFSTAAVEHTAVAHHPCRTYLALLGRSLVLDDRVHSLANYRRQRLKRRYHPPQERNNSKRAIATSCHHRREHQHTHSNNNIETTINNNNNNRSSRYT